MNIKKRRVWLVIMLVFLLLALVACSNNELDEVEEIQDPVEETEVVEEEELVEEEEPGDLDITIDPEDIEFTWGSDDYGENGWVFTSTGTMKMEIPQGWEPKIALDDSAIGVRSDSQDGDTIEVTIQEYSSMIKDPADRTPENQAIENHPSESEIFQDRWGNVDVWYGIKEWTDYDAIAGYAAYNDEECLAFDIRAKTVNGSLEEFMESEAWDTFKNTFELQVP